VNGGFGPCGYRRMRQCVCSGIAATHFVGTDTCIYVLSRDLGPNAHLWLVVVEMHIIGHVIAA